MNPARPGTPPRRLRDAAATIFALGTILPMLVFVFFLWRFDLLWESEIQAGIFVALAVAVLAFAVFRRLLGRFSDLAQRLATPAIADVAAIAAAGAEVPGVGNVGEIGEIAGAFGKLLNDLRGSTERLEDLVFKMGTLNEMVDLATRIPRLRDLLDLVIERTMQVTRATSGAIMLVDDDKTVHLAAARGLPDDFVRLGVPQKIGEGLVGRIVEIGEPVLVEDVSTDPRFAGIPEARAAGGSFIGMPIRIGDRIVGVLNLARRASPGGLKADARPFSFTDLQFLSTVVGYAAYAVDNARLLEATQQSARRLAEVADNERARGRELAETSRLLKQLIDIGIALSSERDVLALLGRILEQARHFTRAEGGTLFLREGSHMSFAVVQNDALTSDLGEEEMKRRLRAQPLLVGHSSLAGHVALTGEVLNVPDAYAIPRGAPFQFNPDVDARVGYRTRSALVVPLTTPSGEVLGVLEVINALDEQGRVTSFDPGYEELVRSFAAHAAVVLTNARLLSDSERRREGAEALARLEQIVSSSLDTTEVLTAITRSAAELMDAPSVTFWVADPAERVLRLQALTSPFGADFPFQTTSFDEGVLGWIATHREPLHVPDVGDDPRIRAGDWCRAHGFTSFYGVPVVWQGSQLGVLALNGRAPFNPTGVEKDLLDTFVAQSAAALRNARLYEDLRVTHERLERSQADLLHSEKLSSLGQLVAGVAHELNNPLAVVLGSSYLIERQIDDPGTRKHVERVRVAAERASEIVRNLLQFARKTLPRRELVDVNGLIDRVLDLAANTLITHDVRIVRDLARDLPGTVGDPGQLQQVFLNLVTNANQAMEGSPGVLTVRTRVADDAIRIEVADTGPGVPPELRTRIFDPFFTTKPTGAGTGLGLSVAHGVITAHEGRIWLDETTTVGACMVVDLPIRPGAAAPPPSDRPVPAGRRILVVDDEPSVGQVLAELLSSLGHSVVLVGSVDAAREALERERFDLITLDLVMPGRSGVDMWRSLLDTTPDVASRVVFVTGTADRNMQEFVESTGRPVLTKPFTLGALREVLGRELSESPPA